MTAPRLICHEENCPALCQDDFPAGDYGIGSAPGGCRHESHKSHACTCRGAEELSNIIANRNALADEREILEREPSQARQEREGLNVKLIAVVELCALDNHVAQYCECTMAKQAAVGRVEELEKVQKEVLEWVYEMLCDSGVSKRDVEEKLAAIAGEGKA
jgi:hypothetical protein